METFCPTNALSRVDFPELGRPTMTAVPYFMDGPAKKGEDRNQNKGN
jgi:hypothetical protein